MPAKNSVKTYVENSYYHLYNRGVEKRIIFQDPQDYGVFLNYLKEYLLPKDEQNLRNRLTDPNVSYKEKDKIIKLLRLNNFTNEITLIAYCLMPNHFHLLVKQKSNNGIDMFMQSLCTRYTMYFNRKYKRVGSLFQSVYKAVLVSTDEQFLHLTRYIHKQSLASQGETLRGRERPSSYDDYIGKSKTIWVHPEGVLSNFSRTIPFLSYESFVSQVEDITGIRKLILDD